MTLLKVAIKRRAKCIAAVGYALLAVIAFWTTSCATVQPLQREALSQRCMISPLDKNKSSRSYEDKVFQTLSGSMLPAGAPGGGCGCVN